MTVSRVYATNKDKVVFVCRSCGAHKEESMHQYKGRHETVNISCSCGNTYMVQIEYRKNYRKKTKLEGRYKKLAPPNNQGEIIVMDISNGGCHFSVFTSHGLQSGDHVAVAFTLDNSRQTMIRKEAIVRFVNGLYVGCSFITPHGTYDPDLGFYLRNP